MVAKFKSLGVEYLLVVVEVLVYLLVECSSIDTRSMPSYQLFQTKQKSIQLHLSWSVLYIIRGFTICESSLVFHLLGETKCNCSSSYKNT